jgi:molybdopterin converting factor small subunit
MARKRALGFGKIGALIIGTPDSVADKVIESYRSKFTTEGKDWADTYESELKDYARDAKRQERAIAALATWYDYLKSDVVPKLVELYADMRKQYKEKLKTLKDADRVAEEVIKALIDMIPTNVATWKENYKSNITAYLRDTDRVKYAKAKLAEWYKILGPKAPEIAGAYNTAVSKYRAIPIVSTVK